MKNHVIIVMVAVDVDKIEANYKEGILHIILPKPESVKPKQIEVEIK